MKRKIGKGRLVSLIGTFIISIGLLLNGLEVIPVTAFRIIVLTGVFLQAAALALIWKRGG